MNGIEVVYAVQGMMCGGCAATVHEVVSKVPGVAAVTVELEAARARVRFAAAADDAVVIAALKAAGYEAQRQG